MKKKEMIEFIDSLEVDIKEELEAWRFKNNIGISKTGNIIKNYSLAKVDLEKTYVQAVKLTGRYIPIFKRVFKKRLFLQDMKTGNKVVDKLLKDLPWVNEFNGMECCIKGNNGTLGGKAIPRGSLYIPHPTYKLTIIKEEWTEIEK